MAQARMMVVAEAEDAVQAAIWVDALRDAGIAGESFEQGMGSALGGAVTTGVSRYPVFVPSGDFGAARSVIAEFGGGQRLAPYRTAEEERAKSRSALLLIGAVAAAVVVMALLARLAAA